MKKKAHAKIAEPKKSKKKKYETDRGSAYPFGPTKYLKGTNFALFSKHATNVSLCLFETDGSIHEIQFDEKIHKTGDVWHIFVYDVPADYSYGYRLDGPYSPLNGYYFDNRMIVIDPFAKQLATSNIWGQSAPKDPYVHCGIVLPNSYFDWEEETAPNIPFQDLIIYEMHVRGFTQDSSSNVEKRGTFQGIIDKIPYLKSLGVNAIELLPIHEFNEMENTRYNPLTNEALFNYWGYSTINFFSIMNRFAEDASKTNIEFKQLVKELHANGIEVILDVVYNHTAEGNEEGPTLSFKGIENSTYYMLTPDGKYYNFSGCGNTFNCNDPIVRKLICESLRYWVSEMHVDGFRFDLASILVRSHDGIPLASPPLIEEITLDPILRSTKLIAEAWDAGGLYQVGSFPAMGVWAEWNGKYRDCIRKFIKGTDGEVGYFATRICGSKDLYGDDGRMPYHSINFITAHDGFTLNDLVSYNHKHNEENGENNADGSNDNDSWNCGVEGETEDQVILDIRKRQIKNFYLTLLVSQGVPMLLMGDEYGHTKGGNNNTWALDSRINWFQWDTLEENQELFVFCQKMIRLRKKYSILRRSHFLLDSDIQWHGFQPNDPDWRTTSRFIAFSLPDQVNKHILYVAFNAGFKDVEVQLPQQDNPWYRLVYTALSSPEDIVDKEQALYLDSDVFTLMSHSALILIAQI